MNVAEDFEHVPVIFFVVFLTGIVLTTFSFPQKMLNFSFISPLLFSLFFFLNPKHR